MLFLAALVFFHPAESGAKEPVAIPRLSTAPKIDGVLDTPVWETEALKIEDFLQFAPKEKGTPTEKTVAYLGFDQKNLYVAFRCLDSDVKKLRASITNRDNCFDDDWVIVFLDTFNEKRRAFSYIINPVGVQLDAIRMEEGGNDNMDVSWDTFFASEGKVDGEGYTVEMAIPFKSLRFPDREVKLWGIVLGRNIPRKGEIIMWPEFSRRIPGLLAQAQEVLIPGKVEKGRNLEVMPVATALQREGEKADVQPGVNLKYGLSSDLTMDFTLNPDFSHIETDSPQIDINLRYALRYQEKRPFFLEGMEIFRHPEIEMVYTRRIIDPLWGAKATGKVGPLAYGVLSAYDLNPTESLWQDRDGGSRDENALFNIVRLKTDVFKESYVGFSLADKEINGSYNRVAGVDGQLKFKQRFFLSFQALASKTKFDGDETDLAPALHTEFNYISKHWGAGAYWRSIHPEFEASSGFVNRVDYRVYGLFTNFNIYPEKKFFNAVHLSFNLGQRDAYFEDEVQDRWARANLQFRFTEFSRLFIRYENVLERYEEIDFKKNSVTLQGENNLISRLPFGIFMQTGDTINYDPKDPFLGWSSSYGLELNFKPNKRLQMGASYSKSTFWKSRGGELVWDFNVVRQRTIYQLSKSLSLRSIIDYNHFYKKVFGSFLISYVLRPGTVFFLGADSNFLRDKSGRYDRRNYSVFLKFSYWWRV